MPEPRERSDLVLNPGEFAFLQDRSKGNISVNVGPLKTSMSDTEQTVTWDAAQRRFTPVTQDKSVQAFVAVPDGSYVVVSNPSHASERPSEGKSTNAVELDQGRRIIKTGPLHFPLWPGEETQVIPGHQLRSNEYLVARVYNEEEAKKQWKSAVIKAAGRRAKSPLGEDNIRTGQLFIVRGNEVGFFIPPTGIEVLPDEKGSYTRDAVTLERLEYCILLNENGNKRYVPGPAVVFPEPTEEFVKKGDEIKFRATELNENSGIYVKVIESYEEDGKQYKTGDELFITGKEQPIYFPRPEHAVIEYGASKSDANSRGPRVDKVIYAVAVPAGEGRYVLDRRTGDVKLVRGPIMLLPDPRHEVIVQRVLTPKAIDLWYPGDNKAIKEHNAALAEKFGLTQDDDWSSASAAVASASLSYGTMDESVGSARMLRSAAPRAKSELVADSLKRKDTYTPPRTITLNTKYEGAVNISVWAGFAVQIVSKTGKRRIVVGPATTMLEYDEVLTIMDLSTGTPKTDDKIKRTAYLQVSHNKVSDVIDVETKDLCKLKVHVSYRVNFEGADQDKWFAVDNYVKLLTEHSGSLVRNAVKQLGVEEFYGNPINVIRDTLLGKSNGGARTGRAFTENGMRIYDVEVLNVTITNTEIAALLTGAQHTTVKETLSIAQAEQRLVRTQRAEEIRRREAQEQAQTAEVLATLKEDELARNQRLALAKVEYEAGVQSTEESFKKELQPILDAIAAAERLRAAEAEKQNLGFERDRLEQEASALKARMEAVSPALIEALTRYADQDLVGKLATSFAPLALLEQKAVTDVFSRYITGTPMAEVLESFKKRAVALPAGTATPAAVAERR